MRIIRQSLVHKTGFLAGAGLIACVGLYLAARTSGWDVPVFTAGELLLVLYILFGVMLWFFATHVVAPLRTIVRQLHAVRRGEKYERIDMTHRIDELGLLANFFNETIAAIERASGDIRDRKRLADELAFTGTVQTHLLPKKIPTIPGLDVTMRTRSATEVGGDTFDIISRDGSTLFYIGDATGHGFPAGLIMSMVSVLTHAAARMFESTRDILVAVNASLQPKLLTTMFMTLVMLRWDHANQKLFYTGCGHEHILVYRARTRTCEAIRSGGIALGMVPDISKILTEKEIPLEAGDAIVLFTDGITEAISPTGEMFGVERLRQLVQENGEKTAGEFIFTAISKAFATFVGPSHVQADDITLLVIKYNFDGIQKAKRILAVDTTDIVNPDKANWAWQK